ncbi:ABC-F family ATP-binding cassette domain-containing protein [Parachlamydia sp. AcF125]|uniref:ABC-F family ATP-binding cassette domain-containing protein n=1 Tax=Parachlamydia sp. AcF125 TaxID=2795736 RepID=UPI001BC9F918|nr:ABC-F family ATP-binding cassette domain-containing protein [Parachlamydia sp. AcF125]MBS4168789.1 Energy-dependent translational throttle protein EttA [Parachlamydia sp. AcF125]
MSPLINCHRISKTFGSHLLFDQLNLSIFKGDRIGIVGPNGAGKSTLLKILAGLEQADSGTIATRQKLKVGYVPQDAVFPEGTVGEILRKPLQSHALPDYEQETLVSKMLSKLGFEDPLQSVTILSGGWKKRLSIGLQLIQSPDILLLDEPTNHLDLEGILWLEKFLNRENLTFLLISHDRFFLENTASKMLELNRMFPDGLFLVDGTYSTFLERKDQFLSGQQHYERSLAGKAREEIAWLKKSPQARTTKAQSRVQQAHRLIDELAEIKNRNKATQVQIDFSSTERQTRKLLTVKNLTKTFGNKLLFRKVDFTLSPGMRLGIIGLNGSGKSTLLKMLAKEIEPDVGTLKFAEGVQIAYFDQQREELPLDLSLRHALAPDGEYINYRGQPLHIHSWCKRFQFPSERLDLPLRKLSGGEKARVLIARLMLKPADILLLDEPTNDLDISTLEVLEESLLQFPGAVILITHDRYLLDRVSTTLIGLGLSEEPSFFADYTQWETYQQICKQESEFSRIQKKNKQSEREPPKQKKLTYAEELERQGMTDKILTIEAKLEELHKGAEKASKDPSKLHATCEELTKTQEKLDQLYARWEELEHKAQRA